MTISPGEPGTGFVFENKIVGGAIPKEYIPGVEKGIASVLDNGVLAGFPLLDINVVLHDGAFHDVDSSVMAFEIAGRAAFREAAQSAAPKLLEPIMDVEVVTEETLATGGSYGNTSLDGYELALGYSMDLADGMFARFEASYMDLDGATLTNDNDSTKSVKADGISGYGAGISIGKSF